MLNTLLKTNMTTIDDGHLLTEGELERLLKLLKEKHRDGRSALKITQKGDRIGLEFVKTLFK